MFAIDGKEPDAARFGLGDHQLPRHDHHLFRREGNVLSGLDGGEAREQAGCTDYRGKDNVGLGRRGDIE
jgi:hypothetical protein